MANIYLRLPSIIAAYHRNYDVNHKLDAFTPVKFSPYTDHAVILRGGLAVFTGTSKRIVPCYSQQQWRNMLCGKTPSGTKFVLKRDPSIWLSYDEICTIEGIRQSSRSVSYDYLCIQMPTTILLNDRETRTNPVYSLPDEVAGILQDLLVRDFKRALVDWEIGTQDYCISPERIIQRGHMDTLERFLMRFDIPVAQNGKEKDSMRRQLDRWLEHAKVLEKAYRCVDITYLDEKDKIIKLK